MHYLVIASGKYCERYKVIKSGSYEELSKYTVKFYNSSEIRKNNKLIISDFSNTYKINGDIVIMDENNNRVRVLYKNDVKLVKELIKSQNLLKYLVSHNMLIVSDYDYKAIMYYKNKDYLKHMKDFLTRKKSYYNIIRIIIRGYEKYQKKHKELNVIPVAQSNINQLIATKKSVPEPEYPHYMGLDIQYVLTSDAILMNPGWENSKGCQLEHKAAELFGIQILIKED